MAMPAGVPDAPPTRPYDHRGSPIPTLGMIRKRFMELRKRRGLMAALAIVNIGIPSVFLVIRLLAHAFDPKAYGPAGGEDIFGALVAAVMYVFGFIVAATLGCSAGSVDLTDGMFRHLVVTGRSRVALYLARIPAGLGIVIPMVGAGFAIVCIVCSFAAPKQISYQGINIPPGLSKPAFETWAADNAGEVVCNFNFQGPLNVPCGPNGVQAGVPGAPQQAELQAIARQMADQNYNDYAKIFLAPPIGLMVRTGLWIELEAVVGFVVGVGLSSLLGQRTIAVILMIVLEVIIVPIASRVSIPYMINAQRGVVGLAVTHLEPAGLPTFGGGNGGGGGGPGSDVSRLIPESRTVAALVIVAWLVGWSVIGAWRMAKRDA